MLDKYDKVGFSIFANHMILNKSSIAKHFREIELWTHSLHSE